MSRRSFTAFLATVALLLGLSTPASAATLGDVDGLWAGIDIDGSRQAMLISGSDPADLRLVLFDTDATICGGGGLLAFGRGSLSGDVVSADYRLICFNGVAAGPVSITYTHDAATNTLTDGVGAVWDNLFG